MRLHDLLDATEVLELLHDSPVDVSAVTHDSRSVRPGALFCCVPGARADGHAFAAAAVERGAVALLVENTVAPAVPQARVASVRAAIGPVAARAYGDPSRTVAVLGVTGTNGKTTTTFLLEAIFAAAHRRPAVIGTAGVRYAGEEVAAAAFTTPEAPDLQRTLRELCDRGADVMAMEVSSHALAERRVDGTRFAAVGFTNLSHEHLDYHGTIEDYFDAKARLFTPEFSAVGVVNLDDEWGPVLAARAIDAGLEVVGYAMDATTTIAATTTTTTTTTTTHKSDVRVRAENVRADATGTSFRLALDGEAAEIRLPIAGAFNVANALAAAALAGTVGVDLATIGGGLSETRPVPGRFETVGAGRPVTVVVDYAHTPAGIDTVLAATRALTAGRVVAVFGCGGNRDAGKRFGMGVAAGEGADVVVLTNDNPRSEEPAAIASAAAVGLQSVGATYTVELDRRRAIRAALMAAKAGDVVVILGKGAETTQLIGDSVVAFDDRLVAAEELAATWS